MPQRTCIYAPKHSWAYTAGRMPQYQSCCDSETPSQQPEVMFIGVNKDLTPRYAIHFQAEMEQYRKNPRDISAQMTF